MARPTIKDVAAHAGVTYQTVSRVINDKGEISAETRQRILAAIATLNYQPNILARNLRQQRTATIGLIVWSFGATIFPLIMQGVHDAARRSNYDILLANVDTLHDEQRYVNLLYSKQVDGLIIISKSLLNVENTHLFQANHLPCVLINRGGAVPSIDTIHWDNAGGMELATRHLLTLGHRHIAHIRGTPDRQATLEAEQGYRHAMQAAGCLPLVVAGEYESEPAGQRATEALLALHPRPTAIVAGDDVIAAGVLAAARTHGLHVPDDLALIGYDDTILARYTTPPLTTVALPNQETGQTAVRLLLEQISGERALPVHVRLPRQLIVRASCGGK